MTTRNMTTRTKTRIEAQLNAINYQLRACKSNVAQGRLNYWKRELERRLQESVTEAVK